MRLDTFYVVLTPWANSKLVDIVNRCDVAGLRLLMLGGHNNDTYVIFTTQSEALLYATELLAKQKLKALYERG